MQPQLPKGEMAQFLRGSPISIQVRTDHSPDDKKSDLQSSRAYQNEIVGGSSRALELFRPPCEIASENIICIRVCMWCMCVCIIIHTHMHRIHTRMHAHTHTDRRLRTLHLCRDWFATESACSTQQVQMSRALSDTDQYKFCL